MLSKFISVSETRFQNTETALKNQQASIQGLETQIDQLSKLISERPQGSLPSNTEPNPREHLNAISTQDKEGFIALEPELIQETMVSKGKSEMPNAMKFLEELLVNKRKLDEASHVELNAVVDKVLLDAADPHIVTTTPNDEIPLTVLSIFPFGTVEVSHPRFSTFKVNNTRVKPYFDETDSRNEEYKLLEPPWPYNEEPSIWVCLRLCENMAKDFPNTGVYSWLKLRN
ncbi:hypothetical protein GOBAR_AA25850 [Gossypium barbadense]|uniref:Uncharacterized protein n=1 Tax=Gossypium barbadense TaxID=3634 RepID=A0A2P5WUP6_GOSBA|nr:hypothetical protein GOBAR_AA25850 [Gossypium barbadense]